MYITRKPIFYCRHFVAKVWKSNKIWNTKLYYKNKGNNRINTGFKDIPKNNIKCHKFQFLFTSDNLTLSELNISPDTAVDVLIAIMCTSNKFMQQYMKQYPGMITLLNFFSNTSIPYILAAVISPQSWHTAYARQLSYINM